MEPIIIDLPVCAQKRLPYGIGDKRSQQHVVTSLFTRSPEIHFQ
jgi:hypothetical protein